MISVPSVHVFRFQAGYPTIAHVRRVGISFVAGMVPPMEWVDYFQISRIPIFFP